VAVTSLHIDANGATAADVAAWLRGVSDVASALARRLRGNRVAGQQDLAGALERAAEEAHSAARTAEEI